MAKGNPSGMTQCEIRRQKKEAQRRGLGRAKKSDESGFSFAEIKKDRHAAKQERREKQSAEIAKAWFDHWLDTARNTGACVIDLITPETEKALEQVRDYLMIATQFTLLEHGKQKLLLFGKQNTVHSVAKKKKVQKNRS